jgi:hypothetical protein
MKVFQEEELKIMSNRQQELRLYEKEENKKIQNMYDEEARLEQENVFILVFSSKIFKGLKKKRRKK